ncbi:Mettl5 [Symbiodinium sp. CCMP2592]|nr:Mettl5 [Symbiodinium sp. CCMP2592]
MGGWVSAFLYRRPLMSVFSHAFGLVDSLSLDPANPRTIGLPGDVASELVLAAALAPLAVSDLAEKWDEQAYATDSSEEKAAIVATRVPPELTSLLWRASDRKGAATKLLSRAQVAIARADPSFEEAALAPDPFEDRDASSGPGCRPVGFRFHFLQIGGKPADLSSIVGAWGFEVGPLLDLTFSPHYDLADVAPQPS